MKNTFIVLSFTALLCFGCKQSGINKKNVDPFYSQDNVFDRLNIPLIKPYKLIKVDDTEWRLELQTTSLLTLSIHNVQGVDTAKGRIFIYSKGGTEVKNVQYNELWFVITPDSLLEQSFESHEAFKDALKKANISKANLRNPDIFYKEVHK
ncbi:hypothetical protein [Chitinophaga filiformis]|uniref:Uncharacterized protein n=1 Tax=Chitinophaga filiformis TaxID=104663 RepID=A0ABY4HTE6_CHIFI|nr:hypothetical protein [Chitinophaga filiformis]UPK66733.1 hypothetical protein MYF79_17495 [Chitinophaga filiformis]